MGKTMDQFTDFGVICRHIDEENFDSRLFTPLSGICANRHSLYRFEHEGQKYVIKLFHKEDKYQNELKGHEFAVRKQVKTYQILKNAQTEKGTNYIVMSFLPGTIGEAVLHTADLNHVLYQMGENIGLLHNNRIEGKPGHGERLSKKPLMLKEIILEDEIGSEQQRSYLLDCCDKCSEMIRTLSFEDVTFGYGHGDYGLQNIIVKDGILTGVIDFEMSGYTNTELDLIQVYRKHLYRNPEAEKAFFDGYCKHMQIAEGFEKRRPVYLFLECLINCSWSFHKKLDYYEENLRFIQDILGQG